LKCNFVGVPYEVKTYTADERGAGTSANVYVQLYGKEIITEEKPLCNKRERDGKFKRGKMDLFTVEVRNYICVFRIPTLSRQIGGNESFMQA
jgi:hypothetical protein